jgi:hypothetical protein
VCQRKWGPITKPITVDVQRFTNKNNLTVRCNCVKNKNTSYLFTVTQENRFTALSLSSFYCLFYSRYNSFNASFKDPVSIDTLHILEGNISSVLGETADMANTYFPNVVLNVTVRCLFSL